MRSKGALGILIVVIVAGLAGCYGCTGYNSLVASDEDVSQAWADVENQYQRRADLVPRLIDVVESAATIDEALIEAVQKARAAVEQTRVYNAANPDDLRLFAENQLQLTASLESLTAAMQGEQGLQSIEAHRDLLVQLEGSENRIAVARRKYNQTVGEYNQSVRRFPKSIVASLFGFEPRTAFTADLK